MEEQATGSGHVVRLRGLLRPSETAVRQFLRGCQIAKQGVHFDCNKTGRRNGEVLVELVSVLDRAAALQKHQGLMNGCRVEVISSSQQEVQQTKQVPAGQSLRVVPMKRVTKGKPKAKQAEPKKEPAAAVPTGSAEQRGQSQGVVEPPLKAKEAAAALGEDSEGDSESQEDVQQKAETPARAEQSAAQEEVMKTVGCEEPIEASEASARDAAPTEEPGLSKKKGLKRSVAWPMKPPAAPAAEQPSAAAASSGPPKSTKRPPPQGGDWPLEESSAAPMKRKRQSTDSFVEEFSASVPMDDPAVEAAPHMPKNRKRVVFDDEGVLAGEWHAKAEAKWDEKAGPGWQGMVPETHMLDLDGQHDPVRPTEHLRGARESEQKKKKKKKSGSRMAGKNKNLTANV